MSWGFYGRQAELDALQEVLGRGRFFFLRLTGRRRIGKTTLVQRALTSAKRSEVVYVQIPDSAPAGVLSAFSDAMDTFDVPAAAHPRPTSLLELSSSIENLIRGGHVVVLDEFQYFSRKVLHEFLSHLQAAVDRLSRDAADISGGLIVLGSLHAELVALLENRDAPLYNRTTDQLELSHLDIGSLLAILDAHGERSPQRLLFLWNLFEGVPKFYRDCFEQGVLAAERSALLERMFFGSSSPLRTEADNWFLSELRGRYDVVLKFVARHPGCSHGELEAHVRELSPDTTEQVGGYLKALIERYRLLEKRLPIFAKPQARSGRYHIRDNFLQSWLAALHASVSAISFRPLDLLVAQANERLAQSEGQGLEHLVAQLYAERSRRGIGDFAMTRRIQGYWDRKDTEIDLVAVNEEDHVLRFVSCKREAAKLQGQSSELRAHVERFLTALPAYRNWRHEFCVVAPEVDPALRTKLESQGLKVQDLAGLTHNL